MLKILDIIITISNHFWLILKNSCVLQKNNNKDILFILYIFKLYPFIKNKEEYIKN